MKSDFGGEEEGMLKEGGGGGACFLFLQKTSVGKNLIPLIS